MDIRLFLQWNYRHLKCGQIDIGTEDSVECERQEAQELSEYKILGEMEGTTPKRCNLGGDRDFEHPNLKLLQVKQFEDGRIVKTLI